MTTSSDRSAVLPLCAARAGWGALLLASPDAGLRVLGQRPSRTARRVLRVLGAREVLQAAATLALPGPAVTGLGAAADALHGATALGWAATARSRRRAGATSALLAVLEAAAGLSARRRQAGPGTRAPDPSVRPAHVPGDEVEHDGLHGNQLQLVVLEGGPSDGARVPLGWTDRTYDLLDDERRRYRYVDTGRTAASGTGEQARVFAHVPD